jgi:hypothetical protein
MSSVELRDFSQESNISPDKSKQVEKALRELKSEIIQQ